MSNAAQPPALERTRIELLALERELIELGHVRRADALERVREGVRQLGEIGSPEGILDRAADELGASSQFDRILISEVRGKQLEPRALWSSSDDEASAATLSRLRTMQIKLEYPLVEEEVA